jgi:hypothetical protein
LNQEEFVPVKIQGALSEDLDALVRKVLRQALDVRPQDFNVHISRSHGDIVVHVREPFDKKLRFSASAGVEIARELQSILTDIVDEECGPVSAG